MKITQTELDYQHFISHFLTDTRKTCEVPVWCQLSLKIVLGGWSCQKGKVLIEFFLSTLHYRLLHHPSLHYLTLHFPSLHYPTLHYTTLHLTTLHYTTLQPHLRNCSIAVARPIPVKSLRHSGQIGGCRPGLGGIVADFLESIVSKICTCRLHRPGGRSYTGISVWVGPSFPGTPGNRRLVLNLKTGQPEADVMWENLFNPFTQNYHYSSEGK